MLFGIHKACVHVRDVRGNDYCHYVCVCVCVCACVCVCHTGVSASFRPLSDSLFGGQSTLAQRRRAAKAGLPLPPLSHEAAPHTDNQQADPHSHPQADQDAPVLQPDVSHSMKAERVDGINMRGGERSHVSVDTRDQKQLLRDALRALKGASRDPLHLPTTVGIGAAGAAGAAAGTAAAAAGSSAGFSAAGGDQKDAVSADIAEALGPQLDIRPVIALKSKAMLDLQPKQPVLQQSQQQQQQQDAAAADSAPQAVAQRMPARHVWKSKALYGPAGTFQ